MDFGILLAQTNFRVDIQGFFLWDLFSSDWILRVDIKGLGFWVRVYANFRIDKGIDRF